MGDQECREKPRLHYAVSVPAQTEATGGATWPAWEGQLVFGGIRGSLEVLGRVGGEVEGGACGPPGVSTFRELAAL